jgi:hypothetical protein
VVRRIASRGLLFPNSPLASKVDKEVLATKSKRIPTIAIITGVLGVVGLAISAQDKYSVKVPNGLAFSQFRGYEAWQVVSISQDGTLIAAILANPVMIKAYVAGVPGNGKPFPDGAKMAKIHWNPKKLETFPAATVPGTHGTFRGSASRPRLDC